MVKISKFKPIEVIVSSFFKIILLPFILKFIGTSCLRTPKKEFFFVKTS